MEIVVGCLSCLGVLIGLAIVVWAIWAILMAVPIVLPFLLAAIGASGGSEAGGAVGFFIGVGISALIWRPWYRSLYKFIDRDIYPPRRAPARPRPIPGDVEITLRQRPPLSEPGPVSSRRSFAGASAQAAGAVGSTCPYCQTVITSDDQVVVCLSCDMPHHSECWEENHGCTTYGCSASPGAR